MERAWELYCLRAHLALLLTSGKARATEPHGISSAFKPQSMGRSPWSLAIHRRGEGHHPKPPLLTTHGAENRLFLVEESCHTELLSDRGRTT